MEAKKLVILFAPISGVGHVNAFRGVGTALKKRGHRVVFAIDVLWKGKLIADGYEEAIYQEKSFNGSSEETDPASAWSKRLLPLIQLAKGPRLESWKLLLKILESSRKNVPFVDEQLKIILEEINPDLIITEMDSAVLTTSNIPFIAFFTIGPLILPDPEGLAPPHGSGYSIEEQSKWEEYRTESMKIFNAAYTDLFNYLRNYNVPKFNPFFMTSKHLNLYLCSEELDYTDIRPLSSIYFRIDATIRDDETKFEIPPQLNDLPGKLIYFSLGSMGSIDLKLMNRLIGILSKSKNRFIVSKGVKHDEIELPPNMWGDRYLPQIKILQRVDLVISHGGNNTLTESLYFGKPLIVLPLFNDQFDNGTRVQEKGLGYTFNPFHVPEDELLDSIERLLKDHNLANELNQIAKRMQSSNNIDEACERIEKVARIKFQ